MFTVCIEDKRLLRPPLMFGAYRHASPLVTIASMIPLDSLTVNRTNVPD
jgi:hypothetical protein